MNFDDPKITAYALGELESAEDRAAIEAFLRDNPDVAAELEETRTLATLLRRELKTEEAKPLTPSQRAEVLSAASCSHLNGKVVSFDSSSDCPWWRKHWVPSAIAATVVLTTSIAALWYRQHRPSDPVSLLAVHQSEPQTAPASAPTIQRSEPAVPKKVPADQLPSNREKVERVKALWIEAMGFRDTGRYDLAFKRAEQILNIDPYNIAARKLQEEINKKREQYAIAGYNHTRSAQVWAVDKAWDRPVRKFAGNTSGWARSASAPAAPSVIPAMSLRESESAVRLGRSSFALSTPTDGVMPREGAPLNPDESGTFNTESYDSITDNAFLNVRENPLSTFSIDVDTASYSNIRRFLQHNQRPPKGAVRIEELLNYFPYSYPQPEGADPFSCTMEVAPCPWKPEHRLVRVGLKGREIAKDKLPPSNLVFLIDVSGSMSSVNKLPLVKECLQQLTNELREQDSVGIVVYAGSSGVALEPTSDKARIRATLDRLSAGGTTNGAAGIQAAYTLAEQAFKKGGNNRVILATDGDFNVGVSSQSELVDLIQEKAKTGVFLSVLGFGMGNTKDSTMEKLADKGNGNYAYIDTPKEGRKVLVEQMAGTLFTIAKDVKIQVEFNPAQTSAYRLIGYENRVLAKEDFNDDTKDAGEIGAGHTVTALFEVVPAGVQSPVTTTVDPLKYQQAVPAATQPVADPAGGLVAAKLSQPARAAKSKASSEMLTLKLRFKQPDSDTSTLREFPLTDTGTTLENTSTDFRWSAAVAAFGMLLRDSPHRGNATWQTVTNLAEQSKGPDIGGYRAEFLELLPKAERVAPVTPLAAPQKTSTEGNSARLRAASIIIPEFTVADLPVLDAIEVLSKKGRESDREKKGVGLVYAGNSKAAQTKVSLTLRDTSVLDVATAVAGLMRLELQEQGDMLIFRAGE